MGGRSRRHAVLVLGLLLSASGAAAETGYDLWLRYTAVSDSRAYRNVASSLVVQGRSAAAQAAAAELRRGLRGMLGIDLEPGLEAADGAVVAGTPAGSPIVAGLGWGEALARLGPEGYLIRSAAVGRHKLTVIASEGDAGVLYGSFHFLRLIQTGQKLAALDVAQRPRLERRLLNHWDNLDGSIERGYAGRSLWNWAELPERVDPRVTDYARANASIGVNGAVINSVNAKAESLTARYLEKTAAIAGALRPYGVRG